MKILHTGDWHVGKGLRRRSRADEHEAVLNEIVGIAEEREVDLVLVAGDQFDTFAPTPSAEAIVYRTLLKLSETGAEVVVIAGNHDNPHRLAAVGPLLDLTNVRTGAHLARPDDGGVIRVETRSGEMACLALFPFQSQRNIVKADDLMSLDPDRHQQSYEGRCRAVVERLCEPFADDTVNLLLSHLTVRGAKEGGGERKAHLLGYYVPAQVFPETAHYVGLGHIHAQQRIAGACPIWYCGAPLQLDFGESPGERGVLLVDAEPGKPAKVEPLPLGGGRELRTIRGTLDQVAALGEGVGDAYLRVVLEQANEPGLGERVRGLFPNAVDVLIAERELGPDTGGLGDLRGDPGELFARYLDERGVEGEELATLFSELLEEWFEADAA